MLVMCSAILYSLGGIGMKMVPWSGLAVNTGRSFFALMVYTLYLTLTHHKPQMNRWIFFGAAAIAGSSTLYAMANKMTTAANAIVLQYTAPIFVVILSALFLRRRPKRLDLGACVVIFLGVLCFFLDSIGGGRIAGDVVAVLSGVLCAVIYMQNDIPNNDPLSATFWSSIMCILVGLPSFFQQASTVPLDTTAIISLAMLGTFQMGLAYTLLMLGLRTTPSITASLISAIEPILNPILVAVFYGEHMGWMSVLGAFIVIGGVIVYNLLKERSLHRVKSPGNELE